VLWARSAPGPWTDGELAIFERQGFIVVDDLFDESEVAALTDALDRLVDDPEVRASERAVIEPESDEVRSVFEVHRLSDAFARLAATDRLADRARQILGSEVSVHQSRVNRKPAFRGRDFAWHSDFETWHLEDGMPAMRAVSASVTLTENTVLNGSLMLIPGSHRTFVGCPGETPEHHYRQSLRDQQIGVPADADLSALVAEHGIEVATGNPGSVLFFDCNLLHGSSSNITPFPRSNVFFVYNSVENAVVEPFGGLPPRPSFVAARHVESLT
jgi:ectoine hydroxylase